MSRSETTLRQRLRKLVRNGKKRAATIRHDPAHCTSSGSRRSGPTVVAQSPPLFDPQRRPVRACRVNRLHVRRPSIPSYRGRSGNARNASFSSADDTSDDPDYEPPRPRRRRRSRVCVGSRSTPACKVVDYVCLVTDSDNDCINVLSAGDGGPQDGPKGIDGEQDADVKQPTHIETANGMCSEEWEDAVDD